MESDLSLLEISGEDDSLLQQIPNDDASSLNTNYFECSPLQVPRSKPPATRSRLAPSPIDTFITDAGKPGSSTHRASANKENVNTFKPEEPKLNVEPQKMKRKKKGGTYNLRKSLAWDKAFFTEEGVLDSLELSMISGNFGKSSGEMLPIIHEEGRESLPGILESASDSAHLQALEENLFKELPASNVKHGKISGTLLPKHCSPARNNVASASTAKRKVLSPHDLNKSGSKRSGCPRPVASSSTVKRSVTMNSANAPDKGTKVSKIPAPKPHPSVHSTTSESGTLGTSLSKKNHIALPVNVPKKVGLKSSSNNIKNIQNGANLGANGKSLTAKSSIQQARKNVVNAASGKHSLSKSQNPLVRKTNDCLKASQDPTLPAPGHPLNGQEGGSRKLAGALSQTAKPICGNMQNAHLQIAKPSGLRMPSPSLGFFDQSKLSASHTLLPRSTQSCNRSKSSIPNVRKPGGLVPPTSGKPLPTARKPPEVVDVTSGNMMVAGSSLESTILSTFNSSSHDKTKSDLHVDGNPSSEEMINNQRKFGSTSNDFRQQSVEHTKPCNTNPSSDEMSNNQQKLGSTSNDFCQQSVEHTKPCNSVKISPVEVELLQSDDKNLLLQVRSFENLKDDIDGSSPNIFLKGKDLIKTEDRNPHFTSCLTPITQAKSASGLGMAESFSYTKGIELAKDNAIGIDDLSWESGGGMHSLNGNLAAERYNFTHLLSLDGNLAAESEKSLAGDNHQPIDLSNSFPVADNVFQDDCKSQLNNGLLHEEHFSSVEPQRENVLQNIISVKTERRDTCENELEISSGLCLIPTASNESSSDMAEMVECSMYAEDTLSGSLDSDKRVEIHVLDLLVDKEPHSQTVSCESESMSEYQLSSGVTGCSNEVINNCQSSGDLKERDLENANCTSQLGASMQVEGDLKTDDMIEHEDVEDKQLGNRCATSHLRNGEANSCWELSTLETANDWLSGSKVITTCFLEADEASRGEYGSQMVSHGLLFEQGKSFQDSSKLNSGNTADVKSEVNCSCKRGLQSPQNISEHKLGEETNEVVEINNVIETSFVENAKMQSSDGSLLVDSFNLNTSVANDESAMIVNEENGPEMQDGSNCCESRCSNVTELNPEMQAGGDVCEPKCFNVAELNPDMQDGGDDMDENAYSRVEDSRLASMETELDIQATSSMSRNQASEAPSISNLEAFNCLNKESRVLVNQTPLSGNAIKDAESNAFEDDVFVEEDQTNISQNNGGPSSEMQSEPAKQSDPTELLENSDNNKEQKALEIKLLLHAVPFSDEWLAAIEAAGEEILTMKSGAVQHSPPEKPQPEPNPWSPVRRKNNQGIGPFDCTKFTNANAQPSDSN